MLAPVILALRRLGQENCHKFKASVGYRVRPVPPKIKTTKHSFVIHLYNLRCVIET